MKNFVEKQKAPVAGSFKKYTKLPSRLGHSRGSSRLVNVSFVHRVIIAYQVRKYNIIGYVPYQIHFVSEPIENY